MPTPQEIRETINKMWSEKSFRKLDWLKFEQTLSDILSQPDMPSEWKVAAAKEWMDAFTRRGHFTVTEYSR